LRGSGCRARHERLQRLARPMQAAWHGSNTGGLVTCRPATMAVETFFDVPDCPAACFAPAATALSANESHEQ
jgi:hypothetical protein